MKLLVDAHALIWALDDPSKLGPQATVALQDMENDLLVGAGTLWEIGIKVGLKKLTLSMLYGDWMNRAIADLGLTILAIRVDHIAVQAGLPLHHRDPFDRLLIAQAQVETATVISSDKMFDLYSGVSRLW